jgi:hypothetical protein
MVFVERFYIEGRHDRMFILYEHGKIASPIAILSFEDAKRVATAYMEASPDDAATLLGFVKRRQQERTKKD